MLCINIIQLNGSLKLSSSIIPNHGPCWLGLIGVVPQKSGRQFNGENNGLTLSLDHRKLMAKADQELISYSVYII